LIHQCDTGLQHAHDRHFLERQRRVARGPGAIGAAHHQRVGLHRYAVAPVALVVAVEQRPRRLAIERDIHLVLAALEGS